MEEAIVNGADSIDNDLLKMSINKMFINIEL